jgi:hypothetical protein
MHKDEPTRDKAFDKINAARQAPDYKQRAGHGPQPRDFIRPD